MKCDRCQSQMDPDDSHEHAGMTLCDDCYMDALSPAKACDPWATYTATRLSHQELNPAQEKILALIDKKGKVPPKEFLKAAGLDQKELERELAALRHMELIRAEPAPDGGKFIIRFK
jgi:hypothetical protein